MQDIDHRRKRLRMRAEHRGIKEMDLLLGAFVRARMHSWDDDQVEALETLLNIDDQSLYAMILGHQAAAKGFEDWINEIRKFALFGLN